MPVLFGGGARGVRHLRDGEWQRNPTTWHGDVVGPGTVGGRGERLSNERRVVETANMHQQLDERPGR